MADSFNKKEREKKKRKRKQDKVEKRKERKLSGVKPPEFLYVDKDGNLSPDPIQETRGKDVKLEDIAISTPKKSDLEQESPIKEGVVKFYDQEKNFGFIKENQSVNEYFVHADNLIDEIKERDNVIFEVDRGPKGLIAVNVKLSKS